jgi:hypothetical protein
MKSSSEIDLRDVSWWISIKNVYRIGVLVTTKLSKEGWIFLDARRSHLVLHISMIEANVGPST